MIFTYFNLNEFDSPDLPNSGVEMDYKFVKKLDLAREIAATPFVINSGYRTPEHNERVGGVADSSHTRGYAADIACAGSFQRWKIVSALIRAGIKRIGIGETFIHADDDPDKPSGVIWYVKSKTK